LFLPGNKATISTYYNYSQYYNETPTSLRLPIQPAILLFIASPFRLFTGVPVFTATLATSVAEASVPIAAAATALPPHAPLQSLVEIAGAAALQSHPTMELLAVESHPTVELLDVEEESHPTVELLATEQSQPRVELLAVDESQPRVEFSVAFES
jgi:hypothetical protein